MLERSLRRESKGQIKQSDTRRRMAMKKGRLTYRAVDETSEQKAAREVVKLIRKLRWIGLEREAEQLQTALSGFPSDKRASLLAGPHSTD